MAIETNAHSFPGIPDSRPGRVAVGLSLLALPLVANVARRFLSPSESYQTQLISKDYELERQSGDLIDGSSFLEVGDSGIQFRGPDPRLETIVFDSQEAVSTAT